MPFLQVLPGQCNLTHFLVSTRNFQGRARSGRILPEQVSTFGRGEGDGMLVSKTKQAWRIDFELDLGFASLLPRMEEFVTD